MGAIAANQSATKVHQREKRETAMSLENGKRPTALG
jgi:hypothetical protein